MSSSLVRMRIVRGGAPSLARKGEQLPVARFSLFFTGTPDRRGLAPPRHHPLCSSLMRPTPLSPTLVIKCTAATTRCADALNLPNKSLFRAQRRAVISEGVIRTKALTYRVAYRSRKTYFCPSFEPAPLRVRVRRQSKTHDTFDVPLGFAPIAKVPPANRRPCVHLRGNGALPTLLHGRNTVMVRPSARPIHPH